ncbi:MAG: rSAM/selenodomain-associated transferase 2 [Flavobacteriaceae bacterium]|jgi:rSAM/selenodomain-associated transferase 2|tara:strand:- start:1309 stop:2016 length:708 start_codon:yes stop_codon:yes gene_type:complete
MTGVLTNKPKISIIVPVFNEVNFINNFISHLNAVSQNPQELIIVDGGSKDGTWEWLQNSILENIFQTKTGRANQMNFGAKKATTSYLYFVHVDSRLPRDFDTIILNSFKKGENAGCFRLKFDNANWLLKKAAAGSKWNHLLCRGGDQSLFVSKEVFIKLNGFDPRYLVCEDIQFIKRIYKTTRFKILPNTLITSSRRFYENRIIRLLLHFMFLHCSHYIGASPKFLNNYYKRYVR